MARKKYKKHFLRDFSWYLSVRHRFNFDGVDEHLAKDGTPLVQRDPGGVDAMRAFFEWDSNGKVLPTRHPNVLETVLRAKGSVNLHIKSWAEDRAKGLFPYKEFRAYCIRIKAPPWVREAVENQKLRMLRHNPRLLYWP